MTGKILLLTGASGALGRKLAPALAARGYRLRLSDIAAFPDPLPAGADFVQADLADAGAVEALVQGVDCILHFGGISTERPWADIIGPNILGVVNIFEAARHQRQRVVFASSNHTIGFYPRGQDLTITDPPRPDGYYGLSKVWGEVLGRMMYDKHGLESVHLRIGSAIDCPTEARHLSTWLSFDDLLAAVLGAIEAKAVGHAVVWAVSANRARWWHGDDAARIGFVAKDNAGDHAPLPVKDSIIAQRYQGSSFAAQDYSREGDDDHA